MKTQIKQSYEEIRRMLFSIKEDIHFETNDKGTYAVFG